MDRKTFLELCKEFGDELAELIEVYVILGDSLDGAIQRAIMEG